MNDKHARMIDLGRRLATWSTGDIMAALKCARKLHRADEAQCNGDAWQDDETGAWRDRHGRPRRNPYGRALATLCDIVARYPGWVWYHQTDPRGCAVYLLSPEVLGEMEAQGVALEAGYTRGVAL